MDNYEMNNLADIEPKLFFYWKEKNLSVYFSVAYSYNSNCKMRYYAIFIFFLF